MDGAAFAVRGNDGCVRAARPVRVGSEECGVVRDVGSDVVRFWNEGVRELVSVGVFEVFVEVDAVGCVFCPYLCGYAFCFVVCLYVGGGLNVCPVE